MGYHPRIYAPEQGVFTTIRARNSELWLVNNPQLEELILSTVAKNVEDYHVTLYGLAITGNHIHQVAQYTHSNLSEYQRNVNSKIANDVIRTVPTYPGGRFWARRFSSEIAPNTELERQFFYTVLQAVQEGLVERIHDHPGYNCFDDAVSGRSRTFTVVDWTKYNRDKRWKEDIQIEHYTRVVTLSYPRLPGYESLSQEEYRTLMYKKLEIKTAETIKERGKPAVGPELLKLTTPGTRPRKTKTSTRHSHRPRVLAACNETRAYWKGWYFDRYYAYKRASAKFRAGELNTVFPPGMYRPPLFTVRPHPPS